MGECFFQYRPTWVVPDKRPLNGCECVCVCAAGGGRVSVDSIGLLQVVSVVQQTQRETRAASPSSSTPRKATGT